jgi:hypothetical protein
MGTETKNCQNCKTDFIIEPDDFTFYEKVGVPAPEICPQCRQQLRMLFRNFKTLYKRPSSLSGKMIVSMYSPETQFPVYESSEWWGDDWDAMGYAKDIDFSRSFLDQVNELFNSVPHPAVLNINSVNCEYSNMTLNAKNCYLVFGCVDNEDCNYGHIVWESRESIDNLYLLKSESCYENIDCLGSAKLLYSQECESCADSIGLFDCRSCTDCIGCVGLIGKSYHVFNQQVTKEEYKKIKSELSLSNPENIEYILSKQDKLRKELPQRSFFGSHNNEVTGNHIYNAHNVHYGFDIKSGENSKFCFTVKKAINSYDASFCGGKTGIEESYEVLTSLGNKIFCSQLVVDSHDVYYSNLCYNSNDLFGCSGLRKKSYCILNKQYSKEEYEKLKEKIIEKMKERKEWGNFFPKELSPFSYNESIVNEYIPLTKTQAIEAGFRWKDNIPSTTGQGTMTFDSLPSDPQDYTDALMKEIFTCEVCDKNYRLISDEISFYKRMNISIPRQCFNCRHMRRMKRRLSRNLFDGTCAHCGQAIKTAYNKEQQLEYKLYCEKCYQQEVV